jgi:hypothetical protein
MTRTREYLRRRADSLVQAATQGKIPGFTRDKAETAARQLRSALTVAGIVSLARSNAELAASHVQWDEDPDVIGRPHGSSP